MARDFEKLRARNLEKVRASALKHARICGLSAQDAEEIAQDVVLWYIENPRGGLRKKIKYVIVDAIRLRFGFTKRIKLIRMPKSDWPDENTPPPQSGAADNVYKLIRPGLDRAVFVLVHKWGLMPDELTEVFGINWVTLSRSLFYASEDIKKNADKV